MTYEEPDWVDQNETCHRTPMNNAILNPSGRRILEFAIDRSEISASF